MNAPARTTRPTPEPTLDGTGTDSPALGSPEPTEARSSDPGVGAAQGDKGTSRVAVEWIGVLVPFTTVLTAIAFWYGWTLTNARSRYLGIDASVLEFSPTDYILRSADALIVPVIAVCVAGIICLGLVALVQTLLRDKLRVAEVRSGAWIALVVSCCGLVVGVRAVFVPLAPGSYYLLAPIVLGSSSALMMAAIAVLHRTTTSFGTRGTRMWFRLAAVLSVTLIIVSLFWGTTLYAKARGRGLGIELEKGLEQLPSVVLYSETPLGLDEPTSERAIDGREPRYRYRYDELRLLLRSSDTYFLLPDGWKHDDGAVIVLHDGPEIRLEFTAGR